jgi:hypothetical protein
MYSRHPIGITGHAAFDELIEKAQSKMATEKIPTEYIDTRLDEIVRGDVIQWRNSEFCVLTVDTNEAENHPGDGQIYLWVVQGDSLRTKGRRKSIQGRPAQNLVRRKSGGAGQFVWNPDGGPVITRVAPVAFAGATDANDAIDDASLVEMATSEDSANGPEDDGPDDFDDAAQ